MRVLLAVLSLAVAVSALGAKFGPKGTIVDFTGNTYRRLIVVNT